MQTRQSTMLNSLHAVQGFLDEHAEQLRGVATNGARKKLDDTVAQLAGYVTDQTGQHAIVQGATKKQTALRAVLVRDHMRTILRIAKSNLPAVPELKALRLPQYKLGSNRVAAAALGMAKAAAPHAGVFVSLGLPADFIAQLEAAAQALLVSESERTKSRGRAKGATTGLKSALSEGRSIVHIMDAFVRSAVKDDSALLANWTHVTHMTARTGRGGSAVTPAPESATSPAPAPAPAPSPAPAIGVAA